MDIATKYVGRMKELLVNEGDLVQTGQLLAQMDTAELQAALAQAKAELARTEAEIHDLKAQIVQRESEWALAKQEFARNLP